MTRTSNSDLWRETFSPMIADTCSSSGLDLPMYVKTYIVELMGYWAERTDFTPDPSFAERFMTLKYADEYKTFADQCLFCVALFPELGQRRGIPTSYYAGLGSSAYMTLVSYKVNVKMFTTLSLGFDVCARVITATVRNNRVEPLLFRL
jgi:hypothetical protein